MKTLNKYIRTISSLGVALASTLLWGEGWDFKYEIITFTLLFSLIVLVRTDKHIDGIVPAFMVGLIPYLTFYMDIHTLWGNVLFSIIPLAMVTIGAVKLNGYIKRRSPNYVGSFRIATDINTLQYFLLNPTSLTRDVLLRTETLLLTVLFILKPDIIDAVIKACDNDRELQIRVESAWSLKFGIVTDDYAKRLGTRTDRYISATYALAKQLRCNNMTEEEFNALSTQLSGYESLHMILEASYGIMNPCTDVPELQPC